MTVFRTKIQPGVGMAIYKYSGSDAPLTDPQNHLSELLFHSSFYYYAAAPGFPLDVIVNHAAITADPGTILDAPINNVTAYTSITETDYVLAAHSLGYVPNFKIAVNGVQYPAGCPIQVGAYGARRTICFWADATNVYVFDSARPSIPGLPAISVTYHVTVFRDPAPIGDKLLDLDRVTPRLRMGYGGIDSNERSMREPDVGETVYLVTAGETMGLSNGRPRFVLADGTVIDVGPVMGTNTYNGNLANGPSKGVAI